MPPPLQQYGSRQWRRRVRRRQVPFPVRPPKMGTFTDTFPGTALNPALWTSFNAVTLAEGIVTLTDIATTASYTGIQSVSAFDLSESQLAAMLVSPGTAEPSTQAVLQVQDATAAYQISLMYGDGNLLGQVNNNGSQSQGGWTAYNAATMAWLRIRESGGTVYFEYAAEYGGTWTALWSLADPFPVTALYPLIQHGAYAATDPQTSSQWGMVNPQAAIVLNGVADTFQLGSYLLETNEYNSTAAQVVTSDGATGPVDFTVPLSGVNTAPGGAPGSGPNLIFGNHWGTWSSAATGLPVPVPAITGGGLVISSIAVTTSGVAAGDLWDVNYDIWFNSSAAGNQSGPNANNLELMIWPVYSAGAGPTGSQVATGVSVAGRTWNVYYGPGGDGECLSYMQSPTSTTLTNLDIGLFAADAVARGYLPTSWYLIDVEFGLEIWTGGAGLTINSFSVGVKLALLADLFLGSSLKTALWQSFGTVAVSNGVLTVTDVANSPAYSGINSVATYDFTNSQVYVQLVSAGPQTGASTQTSLQLRDANQVNSIAFVVASGTLQAQVETAGNYVTVWSATYSATAMAWLRLREASGVVYFEYSANGVSWTTAYSLPDPPGLPVTALYLYVQQGQWGGADPQTSSQWANLNAFGVSSPDVVSGADSHVPAIGAGPPVTARAWQ